VVVDLTGDWYMEQECENISRWARASYDEIIYLGDKEDLEPEGVAAAFASVSKLDKYNFDEGRYGFYYNE